MKKKVKTIFIMGDSLSDSGNMHFGSLPNCIAKLDGSAERFNKTFKGPYAKRYANAFNYADILSYLRVDMVIRRMIQDDQPNLAVYLAYMNDFTNRLLRDGREVALDAQSVVSKNYAKGGSTSKRHGLFGRAGSLGARAARSAVSNLDAQRAKLLKENADCDENAESLVIEFTGANDLVTVNSLKNTSETRYKKVIDDSIRARMKNIKELALNGGYQHFVLLNLPDLSLGKAYKKDRYKKDRYKVLRPKLKRVVELYNRKLAEAVEVLRLTDGIDITLIDTYEAYNAIRVKASTDERSMVARMGEFYNRFHPSSAVQEELAVTLMAQLEAAGYDFSGDDRLIQEAVAAFAACQA